MAALHSAALPFHRALDLPGSAGLTGNGREFRGPETHPYERRLNLTGIERRTTKARSPKSEPWTATDPSTMASGFVERSTALPSTGSSAGRRARPVSDGAEALQADLDARLVHHNTERPHLGSLTMGHPTMGRRPADTVASLAS